MKDPWDIVSDVTGWGYFFAWSLSFYPQMIINYRRKSVEGFSVDFATLNVLGFFATACTLVPFISARRFKRITGCTPRQNELEAEQNDVVFALHALFASSVQWSQAYLCGYNRGEGAQNDKTWENLFIASVVSLMIFTILVAAARDKRWDPNASSSFWSASFWSHNALTW